MTIRRPFSPKPNAALLALSLVLVVLAPTAGAVAEEEPLAERLIAPEQVEPITAAEFGRVLDHHRGEVVVINLWATWCIPCVQELPELDLLQQRLGERGLRVLAVSLDDPDKLEERVRPFFAEKAPHLVSYLNAEEDSFAFVEPLDPEWVGALPTSFFVDRSGEIREAVTGRLLYRTFEEKVLALLEEK